MNPFLIFNWCLSKFLTQTLTQEKYQRKKGKPLKWLPLCSNCFFCGAEGQSRYLFYDFCKLLNSM